MSTQPVEMKIFQLSNLSRLTAIRSLDGLVSEILHGHFVDGEDFDLELKTFLRNLIVTLLPLCFAIRDLFETLLVCEHQFSNTIFLLLFSVFKGVISAKKIHVQYFRLSKK